jgi:transcriptional regulator with XRE-family HTH domain
MASLSNENINILLAHELVRLRKKNGYTSYEKFAIENGFARKHYWMVEKGQTRITIEYLERVLDCYNIQLSEFFISLNL